MNASFRWLIIASGMLLGSMPALKGGPVNDAEQREAQLLLEQAFDHGYAWRQGIVEISLIERKPNVSTRREFLAFDHDDGLIRFDCEEERPDGIRWTCKHIITPQEIQLWTGDGKLPTSVTRFDPSDGPRMPAAEPYDLQALTVADANSVVNHRGLAWQRQFHTELYSFRPDRVVEFQRNKENIETTWELPARAGQDAGGLRKMFVFSLGSGGLPIRVVTAFRHPDTKQWEPYGETTITWQPVKETWVPVAWKSENTLGSAADVEMTFDWKSLNEPLPKQLFTLEDFELDPRTLVVNMKLGAPVIEGPIQEVLSPPTETTGFETGGEGRFWLVLINVVLLTLIVAVLLWRYRGAAPR